MSTAKPATRIEGTLTSLLAWIGTANNMDVPSALLHAIRKSAVEDGPHDEGTLAKYSIPGEKTRWVLHLPSIARGMIYVWIYEADGSQEGVLHMGEDVSGGGLIWEMGTTDDACQRRFLREDGSFA